MTVFRTGSKNPKCCKGNVELFSPDRHVGYLISASNSWVTVWKKWKDNEFFQEISNELMEQGSWGAANHINVFIERLLEIKEKSE